MSGDRPVDGFGPVDDVALWGRATHDLDQFRHHLGGEDQLQLQAAVEVTLTEGRELDELTAADLPVGSLAPALASLRSELMNGSGFAIVDGFDVANQSVEQLERLFWGVGLALGEPVSQSVMGDRLGHVVDVTKTDPNARAYRNNSELTPHTDPADLLSFLCVSSAASGGVSRFVSSMAIHEVMRRERPDLLERLYRGYHYHRAGEERPGSAAMTPHRLPVFSEHEGVTSCRYVRFYIEVAAEQDPSIALDDLDREALDMFEALAAEPSLHFEFTLKPGEAVFANNFTVLHARSSFANDPLLAPRHLLRLWLSTNPRRPIGPNVLHYDGEPGIQPVAGRMPSFETDVELQ